MTTDCPRCRLVPCLCRRSVVTVREDNFLLAWSRRRIIQIVDLPLHVGDVPEYASWPLETEGDAIYSGRPWSPWSPELRHKCPKCEVMTKPRVTMRCGDTCLECPECWRLFEPERWK